MSDAHRKAKTPEQTRRALLDQAAALALRQGIAAITLPAVAEAAGVTKGAVFHHFGSKQGLTEALCADLIARIDEEIDAVLAEDTGGRGSFTRVYIACTFTPSGNSSPWSALSLSALTDPGLARIWSDWLEARLARHAATDDGIDLHILRLAADGVWLSDLQGHPYPDRMALCLRLLAATRQPPPASARPTPANPAPTRKTTHAAGPQPAPQSDRSAP